MLFTVIAAALVSGCIGPIDYLNTVARKGRRAVSEARSVNAEKLSPYEYWSAVTYLRMAREKASSADYQAAGKYGRKAVEMGELAKKIATDKAQHGPLAKPATPEETPVVIQPASPASDQEGEP
jgi:hypothetical protein